TRPDRPEPGRDRAPRRRARRHRERGRAGRRGCHAGRAGHLAPAAAGQRDAPRRGDRDARRARGHGLRPAGRGRDVRSAADPGGGRLRMAETSLTHRSAADLADLLRRGETSSVEVTQAHLDRTAEVDPAVHAYLHVNAAEALATAADVDARRAAGEDLHELAGVPIAVKDVVVTKGQGTTA